MLPLSGVRAPGNDIAQFYQGFLLGLEEVRARGGEAEVTVWDTAGDAERVFNMVVGEDFRNVDLIVGPVYERETGYAVQFADLMSVPVVSPLATLREADSEWLWQMAPDPAAKYDKVRELLGTPKPAPESLWGAFPQQPTAPRPNVIVVSSASGDDAEFAAEMETELAGVEVKRFTVSGRVGAVKGTGEERLGSAADIATLIDWDRENVFVVLAAGELAVDDALATISSSYSNASARLSRTAPVRVLGSSKWAQFGRIDRNLYFKLGVRFVTSYYIDRAREDVRRLDERFLAAYGALPTRAAWRGWDAATVFVGALMYPGRSFDERVGMALQDAPTGVGYDFGWRPADAWGVPTARRRVNLDWQLIEFSSDFKVTVR